MKWQDTLASIGLTTLLLGVVLIVKSHQDMRLLNEINSKLERIEQQATVSPIIQNVDIRSEQTHQETISRLAREYRERQKESQDELPTDMR